MASTRRLAAILAADVAGFYSLIDADPDGTLQALKAIRRDLVNPIIEAHNGRLLKTSSDLLLVEFSNVVEALRCATDLQRTVAEHNRNLPADKRIEFRIGIHQGDVVVQDGYHFGDGVNIATDLEGLAQPGGICLSARAKEDAEGKLAVQFEDMGEQRFKNRSRRVRTYQIPPAAASRVGISERATRRLAAILAADVVGYSRLMGEDEEGTHERLKVHFRELVEPKIAGHSGRIVKNTGDGLLAEFPSVVEPVRCAVEVQRGMIDREPEMREERRIWFRIGINLGDVIVEPTDIFGDGVNLAARLEALAEPGASASRAPSANISAIGSRTRSRTWGNRASRTLPDQCGSLHGTLRPSPICRHLWRRPLPQPLSPRLRHVCRSSSCPSPTSATTQTSNISQTG
jgi:class 3 adenylate cyclase